MVGKIIEYPILSLVKFLLAVLELVRACVRSDGQAGKNDCITLRKDRNAPKIQT